MSTEKTPSGMAAYVSVMRPDHWLKNIFILFGHGAAVVLLGLTITPHLVWLVVYSLVPACLVASANYILNEILDAPFDRLHPTKHARAVASGAAKESVLWILMILLLAVAFAMAWWSFNLWFFVKKRGVEVHPEGRRGGWKTKSFSIGHFSLRRRGLCAA